MTRPIVVEAEPAFRTAHANPYNARLYGAMAGGDVEVRELSYRRLLTGRVDIVHLHWPDLTFLSGHRRWRVAARLFGFFGALRLARRHGTRLVWTVHNVEAHETRSTPALRARSRRLLLGNVDGILALTDDGVDAARAAHPELETVPAYVTPHGHYRDDYDFGASRAEARAALGLDPAVPLAVTVGQIRPYKNVPHLLRVFAALEGDAALGVAGKPSADVDAGQLERAVAADPRVRAELAFLPPERLALWLRAADLVVLPYARIQNSGSAVLALSADRPVLVPALGAMRELAETVGPDWVRSYEGELDAAGLAAALDWARGPRADRAPLDAFDWPAIAERTVDAYRSILAAPRPARRAPRAPADERPGRPGREPAAADRPEPARAAAGGPDAA